MPGAKSDYLENKILDHVLGPTAYTKPTTVYTALFSAAPGDAGGGTETTVVGRVASTFGAASGGSNANSAIINHGNATGAATLVAFGEFDASTGGNLLYYGLLTTSKSINSGDPVRFDIGTLTFSED